MSVSYNRQSGHESHEHAPDSFKFGRTLVAFANRLPRPSLKNARACAPLKPACDPCRTSNDAGEIHIRLTRAERTEAKIRIRNCSSVRREFHLEGVAFSSESGKNGGKLSIKPGTLSLRPGEIRIVELQIDASGHTERERYFSAVTIGSNGCASQALNIWVKVEPETLSIPVINLGCLPERQPRPQTWQDHYYCDPPVEEGTAGPGRAKK